MTPEEIRVQLNQLYPKIQFELAVEKECAKMKAIIVKRLILKGMNNTFIQDVIGLPPHEIEQIRTEVSNKTQEYYTVTDETQTPP